MAGWGGQPPPGQEAPWMVGSGHMYFRLGSIALSLWPGPLPPLFSRQEGQVVAVILHLALATERFANSSRMEIPPSLFGPENVA